LGIAFRPCFSFFHSSFITPHSSLSSEFPLLIPILSREISATGRAQGAGSERIPTPPGPVLTERGRSIGTSTSAVADRSNQAIPRVDRQPFVSVGALWLSRSE